MKNKTLICYYYFGGLVAALLTAITHTVLYLNQYDFVNGLWATGTPAFFSAISYLLLIPTAILAVLFAISLKKSEAEEKKEASDGAKSRLVRAFSLAAAVCFVLTLIAQFAAIGTTDKLYALFDVYSESYMALTAALHILTLIFALPAAWYFLAVFLKKPQNTVFGIAVILYFVFYTLRVYFDLSLHINNPRWSFGVVTLIAVMLYFVFEVHRTIRREMTFAYVAIGFLAVTLALTKSVSDLVLAIGFYTRDGFELVYSGLLLVTALYIAARLFALTRLEAVAASEETPTLPSQTDDVFGVTELTDTEPAEDGEDLTADVEDPEESAGEDAFFEELTQDELKRFYGAVYQTVARKRGLSEDASDEEKKEVRRETLAVIEHLLNGDSRQENVIRMREFLLRVEGRGE